MKQMLKSIIYSLTVLFIMTSCSDSELFSNDYDNDNSIQFTSAVTKSGISTRADELGLADKYIPLPKGYEVKIVMSKKNTSDIPVDSSFYKVSSLGKGNPSILTVKPDSTALYWPDNTTPYAFRAYAGMAEVPTDQSSADSLIAADRLFGYAGTNASHDDIAYKIAKDWKSANSTTTIPLYLKHQCAMISIILKPGEGVWDTAVDNANVGKSLSDSIYSYKKIKVNNNDVLQKRCIIPSHASTKVKIDRTTDSIKSTKFTAIVEPFNYTDNPDNIITRIVINNQKYSFSASNDDSFYSLDDDVKKNCHDAYNLTAGKHLEITITVGRDGRLINVFAQQKDWEIEQEEDFYTDDFGHGADPVMITKGEGKCTTQEISMEYFLKDSLDQHNEKGVIAILSADINLTKATAETLKDIKLNATINLNGHTITTPRPIFSSISETGIFKNGTIKVVKNDATGTTEVAYAIANDNNGTIEKITVTGNPGITATTAGLVGTNKKDIKQCINKLKVVGSEDYIGGIAAQQESDARIINCTVYSKVCTKETSNITTILGGIVGQTDNGSIVTGCTYDYGITLDQQGGKIKNNIIGEIKTGIITANNNSWPTIDLDNNAGTNTAAKKYEDVIDNQEELKAICNKTVEKGYRIADNFAISNSWDPFDAGIPLNLNSNLEGNNKTITTNSKMIFQNITKSISNLNILLNETLVGTEADKVDFGRASLAKILEGGTLDNIVVRAANNDVRIQAPNPAGIVVAAKNATITNCRNYVSLHVKTTSTGENTSIFAGGIVAEAKKLIIRGCYVDEDVKIEQDEGISDVIKVVTGGIIGVAGKESDDTGSVITDCSCLIKENILGDVCGGIIGEIKSNGISSSERSIGNWWAYEKGVGTAAAGAGSIGVKNAIVPSKIN